MALNNSAPYDERNVRDYQEMSKRIADALEEIAHDPSLAATQKELSKRAKCSRGTLRNRGWPIARLKSIAAERREKGHSKQKNITLEHRTTVEVHIEDKKRLLEQLEKSRTEAAVWCDKLHEAEKTKNKILREKELILGENKSLKERNDDLERQLRELKTARRKGRRKKTILPFPKPVKNRAGGGRKDGMDD